MKHQLHSSSSVNVITLIIILAIFLTSAGSVLGQDVASGLTTATVQTGLTIVATQALAFGNVLQGVAKTVGNNEDANSGIFDITGFGGAQISTYMTLPAYLATASGNDRMLIAFGNTDCTLDTVAAGTPGTPGGGAVTNQNPNNMPLIDIGVNDGVCRLYLGGRVTPAVDQTAGAYTGDITCTVAYTGS